MKLLVYTHPSTKMVTKMVIDDDINIMNLPAHLFDSSLPYRVCEIHEARIHRDYDTALYFDQDMNLKIDMNKAIEVKANKLRGERDIYFKDLDVKYMRALEANDTVKQQEVVHNKNILRNITNSPLLLNAKDVQELQNIKFTDLLEYAMRDEQSTMNS